MPSRTITVYDSSRDRTLSFMLIGTGYGSEEIVRYSLPGRPRWFELTKSRRRILFSSLSEGVVRRRFDLLRRQLRNSRRFQVL